jgi:hypothetical protein
MKAEPLYYDPKTGKPTAEASRVAGGMFGEQAMRELARLQRQRNALRRVILEWFELRRPDDYDAERHARDWGVNTPCVGDELIAETASKILLEQEV